MNVFCTFSCFFCSMLSNFLNTLHYVGATVSECGLGGRLSGTMLCLYRREDVFRSERWTWRKRQEQVHVLSLRTSNQMRFDHMRFWRGSQCVYFQFNISSTHKALTVNGWQKREHWWWETSWFMTVQTSVFMTRVHSVGETWRNITAVTLTQFFKHLTVLAEVMIKWL